ncbi:glutamate--tRNA ligase [Pararhodospirillum oryzae]|uniref:Glutamate--tRNA ligase n=1 Tax=Pararhodospirillum oryzae TaxID=478448 RepID=A0A512H5K9_9PROT|nr:glutamate--tRNA ligase [Pararhodospirillum oryzae]GEO80727.1 glutamate--tRNA ligase 1 [Pararhodospirillum oryzae]
MASSSPLADSSATEFPPSPRDPAGAVVVRFAPSPTGRLHLGNARIAVLNALYARAHGGSLILRMDDTDEARGTEAFAQAIREDLTWLGLTWVREESQKARAARHAEALETLRAAGRLYPCYETPEELEGKRRRQLARGKPPVYDRAALALSEADRARLEAEGRRPHWRFLLEARDVTWVDLVRGPSHAHAAHLSDPVLVREDGGLLYTLPSVVDDLDFGVTHVIRGEDHVVNTAVQIQIAQALGGRPPAWAHLPLVLGPDGGPLSKRDGALSIGDLRDEGIEAAAIVALMAALGSGTAPDPTLDWDAHARAFRLEAFGRAQPRLDPADLARLSTRVVHALDGSQVRARGYAVSEAHWAVLHANLTRLDELPAWLAVIDGTIEPVRAPEDEDFLARAAACLPAAPWDETTWKAWTGAVKAATGRGGRALFRPLRLALTGLDHGPEMAALLPLMGRERVLARLAGEKA